MGVQRRSMLAIGLVTLFGVGAVGGMALASDSTRLRTELSGAVEVPPADPDGSGRATIDLSVEEGKVCFSLRFSGTGTPNRGHIHVGLAGTNGGIVIPLFELVGAPGDPRNDELEARGRLSECVAADPAVVAQIAENPGNYYVNLHNARFPAGAIRGQLG